MYIVRKISSNYLNTEALQINILIINSVQHKIMNRTKCKAFFTLFSILLFTSGCFSAGESVLKCYNETFISELQIDNLLQQLWNNNPELRVNSADIKKIKKVFPLLFDDCKFSYPINCDTCVNVFKSKTQGEYSKSIWYLKSEDGSLIFQLSYSKINGNFKVQNS
jgi:hypothetical protein